MNRRFETRLLVYLPLFAGLLLSACGSPNISSTQTTQASTAAPTFTPNPTPTPTSTPRPTPTVRPSPTATSTLNPGDTLLSDSFDNNKNHWDIHSAKIKDGHLVFNINTKDAAGSVLRVSHSDVHMIFEVTHESGDKNTEMGAVCRYNENGDYYVFFIYPDGYYTIVKFVNGEGSTVVEATYSDAIHTGKTVNTIEVICAGPWLQMIANHQILTTVRDYAVPEGQEIALYASSESGDPVVVSFDNFLLVVPDNSQVAADGEAAILAAISGGLTTLPTALAGKTNTIFPVPGDMINYVDYGDGVISFDTHMSLKEIASYYRDILAQNALTEEINKTSITDSTLYMVFDMAGINVWVIEGANMGNGLTSIKIHEEK